MKGKTTAIREKQKGEDIYNRYKFYFLGGALLLILTILVIKIICNSYTYEMNHAYTADAPMYWTVGRGILNGIKPYSGLYENKPVGVFLISALSMLLTDEIILCDAFCLFCLILIGFMPAVFTGLYWWNHCKRNGKESLLLCVGFALIQGFLLMLYCEERSGGFQVESMGAALTGLYFLAAAQIQASKVCGRKKMIIWMVISAFFVMCGVMMKEPFVLLMISGSLLFTDCIQDIIRKTVIPICLGGIMTVLLLAVSGILPEYFQIYLKNMLGSHINIYGSPFRRALNFNLVLDDIRNFSEVLLILIGFSLLIYVLNVCFYKNSSIKLRIWKLLTILIAIFCASFAVGLGGQYYNHHYIFAAPLYLLFMVKGCQVCADLCKDNNKIIIFALNFALLISLGRMTNLPFGGDYTEKYYDMVKKAEYADALLDYYGEDTFQFLGFNGENNFLGLLKHSPQGPLFVQDPNNFMDESSWASTNLLEQLDRTNIVIVDSINIPAINDKVTNILNTQFTTVPAREFTEVEKPESFTYQIYYRIEWEK